MRRCCGLVVVKIVNRVPCFNEVSKYLVIDGSRGVFLSQTGHCFFVHFMRERPGWSRSWMSWCRVFFICNCVTHSRESLLNHTQRALSVNHRNRFHALVYVFFPWIVIVWPCSFPFCLSIPPREGICFLDFNSTISEFFAKGIQDFLKVFIFINFFKASIYSNSWG